MSAEEPMTPMAGKGDEACSPRFLEERGGTARLLWRTTLIFAATLAAYGPVLGAGFIWDDDGHVTRPDLRSLHGLKRIWFELGATQQYYPVLHSAFWVEHRLWGDAALGYHLVNILLHATAACLFGVALKKIRNSKFEIRNFHAPLFAALIFALHPVCVESVAWVSEQKNTLSTVFYLLAVLTYLNFTERIFDPSHAKAQRRKENPRDVSLQFKSQKNEFRSSVGLVGRRIGLCAFAPLRETGLGWYVPSFALFILAVLSKSVTVTLPAALLVIAWWQRGRLSWKRDVLPLVPFFAIGIAGGLLTAWVERRYIGARGAAFDLSLLERGLLAGRVIGFYLVKLVWPANLMFVYPRWPIHAGEGWQYLFPLGVVALLAALWSIRRRTRGPLAGVLFFVGTLFPALGFFNVYPFVFSYVADHFQYLAMLGIVALATSVFRLPSSAFPRIVALSVLCLFGILTFRQCGIYRDNETLYRATLAKNPDAWLAHDNLGVVLEGQGRMAEAIGHYREALRLNSNYPETYNNLGNAFAHLGNWSEASAAYAQALRLRPNFAEAEYDWANVLNDSERYAEAAFHYENALRLRPNYPDAEYRMANALANSGQLLEAIGHYEAALRLRPDHAEAHANLGLALNGIGRIPEALVELREAERLAPNYPEVHAYLGLALTGAGRLPEGVAEYRRALQLRPGDADVHYQLGVALRALGETDQAAAEFEAAAQK